MSKIVRITNTKVAPLTLYYRAPGNAEASRPLISVLIQSRALSQSVVFADDEHFEAFKEQNAEFLENQTIIIGDKVKASTAEKVNEENAIRESKEVKKKKDRVIESLEGAVNSDKASLKVSVEKE